MPRKPAPIVIEKGKVYTTGQVCAWLRCTRAHLLARVHAGDLPVEKSGKEWRYLGDDLLALFQPLRKAS